MSVSSSGVVSAAQAAEVGISRQQLRDAVRVGVLQRLHPSVFWIGAGAPSRTALVHAAVMAVGPPAVASHESALHMLGVDRVPFAPVVSIGPTGRANLASVRVHRVRDMHPDHVAEVGGLLVTTIERSLVDVATVFSRSRTEWLLDHLTVTQRRTSLGRIARVVRQVNRKGRVGIGSFTAMLDARGPGPAVPRSRLERSADSLLALTSLPTPVPEYPLPSLLTARGAPSAGFVDRAWPRVRLILEVDGRPWHARERDMARDRRRDRGAAALGWQTLRVLDEEIRDIPDDVVSDLVAAYAERLLLLRPA